MTDHEAPFGTYRPGLAARLAWRAATVPSRYRFKTAIRRAIRKQPRFQGPFDVTVEGLHFRVYPAQNYDDRILLGRGGLPELVEHGWVARHFSRETFVDIGANVGTFCAFAGVRGARVLAFEPHPQTVEKLRFNLAANGVKADIVQAACGPRGRMTLWSDGGGNVGGTSLLPEATSNAKIPNRVEVVPLLDALEEHSVRRIGVLKIDIEGFEDRALGPFLDHAPAKLLPRAILIEREHDHLWERDLDADLRRRGYVREERTWLNELWLPPER